MDGVYFLRCRFDTAPSKLATIKGELCLAEYTHGFVEGDSIIFRFLKYQLQCFIVLLPIACSNQDVISLIEASRNVCSLPRQTGLEMLLANTSLLGLKLPHGVLKVTIHLDSGFNTNWWYPCRRSSFVQIVQS